MVSETDDGVAAILLATHHTCCSRQLRCPCATINGQLQIGLHTDLIPEPLYKECLQRAPSSFDDERLDVVKIKALEIQGMLTVHNQTTGIGSHPVTHSQLRMFTFVSNTPHEDGILLSTKLMGEHLREVTGDVQRTMVVIDEAVGRLCPFQDDIGTVKTMEGKEPAVQRSALLFQHPYLHVDARIAQLLHSPAPHLSKLIDTSHDNTADALLDD